MTATTTRALTPESIAWRLAQLVEDFASATQPTVFDPTYNEVTVPAASVERAMRAPVAFGAVLDDVARALGVETPWIVRQALGDDLTPPDAA